MPASGESRHGCRAGVERSGPSRAMVRPQQPPQGQHPPSWASQLSRSQHAWQCWRPRPEPRAPEREVVADLRNQGRVPAAPVIGLAGGDPLAGLTVGGEPAPADVEVAGRLGHRTGRAALGCSHRRRRGMAMVSAPSYGGLVSGFVSGTYRVLLGRGGISWHERRAFVLVRWLVAG
jgi:hypothetical protein